MTNVSAPTRRRPTAGRLPPSGLPSEPIRTLATRFLATGLCGAVLLASHSAAAANLTAGPGQQFATIAAAVAASRDGDTVTLQPGDYVNDFAEIRTKITLRGNGAHLRATQTIPNGKGILITDTDVTISSITFIGAKVADGNGAGIRYQGGALVVNGCWFMSNQNGILANPDPNGSITILRSEFSKNGVKSGSSSGYTHNLYVNAVAKLTIDGSYFHDAYVGHEIKSRAKETIITNTRVVDGPNGTASYSIDLPNGGRVSILDNQIEQGPRSQNPAIISFGEEGGVYAGSALTVAGNLIENDLASGSARAVVNAANVTASVTGNTVYGLSASNLVSGSASVSGNTYTATEPAISTAHPWAN